MRWALISLWLGISVGWLQDVTPPAPLPGNVPPTYPPKALARPGQLPVEGDVAFTAAVSPQGSVDSVSILQVPWKELGFEDAVTESVAKWRFTPGRADDNPIAATYVGKVRFVAPGELPFESSRMYGRRSRDVWDRAVHLIQSMKIPIESKDEEHQILVTRPVSVHRNVIDHLGEIDLVPSHPEGYVQLQVFVSPYVEPARVHVGSVVLYTLGKANKWHINAGQVENLFLSALDELLGEVGHPIPVSFIRRGELAASLDEGATPSSCLSLQESSDPIVRRLLVMPRGTPAAPLPESIERPTLVHHPDMVLLRRVPYVRLSVRIATLEDGSVAGTIPEEDEPLRDDQRFVLGAMMLMKFSPVRYDDCFYPTSMRFRVTL